MIDVNQVAPAHPLRIIIGAGNQKWPGWISTDKNELDLLNPKDWEESFRFRKPDAFLCEHVFEHLTIAEARVAASLCYKWLKPGGYLRCAVPDGNFPDKHYQQIIGVGGIGTPSHPGTDHKVVYNYKLLSEIFTQTGFEIDLLEYCDDQGRFHYNHWIPDDGPIYRSLLLDWRNQKGKIVSASLIMDAKKNALNRSKPITTRLKDIIFHQSPPHV